MQKSKQYYKIMQPSYACGNSFYLIQIKYVHGKQKNWITVNRLHSNKFLLCNHNIWNFVIYNIEKYN